MPEKTISCKVDEESDLYEQLEEFEERYGNRSQAIRAALGAGIEAETDDDTDLNTFEDVVLTVASVLAGVVLFLPLVALVGVLDTTVVLGVGLTYLTVSAGLAFAVDRGVFRPSVSSSTSPASGEVAD